VVEISYELLKGRLRRLREITVHKPRNIVSIIVWGCILHNLTIINHEDIEEFMEADNDGHPNRLPNIFRNNNDALIQMWGAGVYLVLINFKSLCQYIMFL
jgi:hypothetical protein